jgi:hypothetical protein
MRIPGWRAEKRVAHVSPAAERGKVKQRPTGAVWSPCETGVTHAPKQWSWSRASWLAANVIGRVQRAEPIGRTRDLVILHANKRKQGIISPACPRPLEVCSAQWPGVPVGETAAATPIIAMLKLDRGAEEVSGGARLCFGRLQQKRFQLPWQGRQSATTPLSHRRLVADSDKGFLINMSDARLFQGSGDSRPELTSTFVRTADKTSRGCHETLRRYR